MTKIWSNYFQKLSQWSFSNIDLDEQNTILGGGFGGGSNIKYMKEHYAASIVYGINISEEALRTATKVNQEYIDSKDVILCLGNVANLQFQTDFFDLIVATQTHIYWNRLEEGLTECYRVMRQNGNLLITCEIKKIKYHLPKCENSNDFVSLLYTVGFNEVNVKCNNTYVAFICAK